VFDHNAMKFLGKVHIANSIYY